MKTRRVSVLPTSDEAAAVAWARMAARGDVETVGALLLGRAADEDVAAMQDAGSIVEVVPEAGGIGWLEPGKLPAAPTVLAGGVANPALATLAREAPERYVIQFAGPLLPEWRKEIESLGVTLGGYVPQFAYKAALVREQKQAVEQVASVRRVVPYGPEQTLRRAILVERQSQARRSGTPAPEKAGGTGVAADGPMPAEPPIYDVTCHQPNDLSRIQDVLEQDQRVARLERGRNRLRIHVRDAADANSLVSDVAALPQVSVIERFQVPTADAAFVREVMAVPAFRGDRPGSTGGEGELIGVADTGVDRDHPDLTARVANVEFWERSASPDDPNGHGTHVCGIICGDGTASANAITGIAPRGRLFVQAIADDDGRFTGIPVDLATLFQEAYDAGVRIHNNSWGVAAGGLYTIDAFEVDQFAYEHPDFLIIIAAGNTGRQTDDPQGRMDLNSLQSPAASKNALTVGACCSTRRDGPYVGKPWSTWNGRSGPGPTRPLSSDEPICGDADIVAAFSSRGPTDESRVKPDLVAPGTAVASAASAASTPGLPYDQFNGRYCFMSGTSMAAPAVAGAAALVRRWYIEEREATPSAALLKATLINGCVWIDRPSVTDPMIGRPNFHQGFGRLDLSRTVPFSPGSWDLAFADIGSGEDAALSDDRPEHAIWRRRVTVTAEGDLSVTLVWPDPPSHGLQHNLNLAVVAPGGAIAIGNGHLARAPFEKLDRVNNVEQVIIPTATPGVYVVQVSASNTMSKKQGFAVVATGTINRNLD